jgi:hypothetical protein
MPPRTNTERARVIFAINLDTDACGVCLQDNIIQAYFVAFQAVRSGFIQFEQFESNATSYAVRLFTDVCLRWSGFPDMRYIRFCPAHADMLEGPAPGITERVIFDVAERLGWAVHAGHAHDDYTLDFGAEPVTRGALANEITPVDWFLVRPV